MLILLIMVCRSSVGSTLPVGVRLWSCASFCATCSSVCTVSLCFLFLCSYRSFVPLSTLKVPLYQLFLCPSVHAQSSFLSNVLLFLSASCFSTPTVPLFPWTDPKFLCTNCPFEPLFHGSCCFSMSALESTGSLVTCEHRFLLGRRESTQMWQLLWQSGSCFI